MDNNGFWAACFGDLFTLCFGVQAGASEAVWPLVLVRRLRLWLRRSSRVLLLAKGLAKWANYGGYGAGYRGCLGISRGPNKSTERPSRGCLVPCTSSCCVCRWQVEAEPGAEVM